MEMTEITIRLPHAGALRLIEEAMKAGVSPDRFIALLIEERLKQPGAPQPASAAEPPPALNADGMTMLRKILGGPGGPPGRAKPARPQRPVGTKSKRAKKRK